MRKLLLLLIAAVAIMSCKTQQKSEPEKTLAQQLEERMDSLQKKGYMAGHQDDPFYGIGWAYEDGKSDVKLTVGDYPAVMGFDLGGIEMGDDKNLDSVPFTRIHDELLAHVKRGGIVTISWHPRNPLTTAPDGGRGEQKFPAGSAWDVNDTTIVKNILPGGQKAELFQTWMQRVGDFLESALFRRGVQEPVESAAGLFGRSWSRQSALELFA